MVIVVPIIIGELNCQVLAPLCRNGQQGTAVMPLAFRKAVANTLPDHHDTIWERLAHAVAPGITCTASAQHGRLAHICYGQAGILIWIAYRIR